MDFRNCLGMMASVSTFARSSGATKPVCTRNGCMVVSSAEAADVDEVPGDRGRSGHCGAHEVGAAAVALASLEVAVGRRCAALARLQPVVVHRQAHRAARLAPLEA